jgi:hypothetical protein
MNKIISVLFIATSIGFFLYIKKGRVVKNIALTSAAKSDHIYKAGSTVSERILLPDGFKRSIYPQNSFQRYL